MLDIYIGIIGCESLVYHDIPVIVGSVHDPIPHHIPVVDQPNIGHPKKG